VVGSTITGSPASQAGLQQGDVIVAYDRTPVDDYRHVQRLVAETRVGKSVTLQIVRKKQKMDVAVTIAEVPDETARRPGPSPKP
jgi:serine protease Do